MQNRVVLSLGLLLASAVFGEDDDPVHPDLRLLIPKVAPKALADADVAFWNQGLREPVDAEKASSPDEPGTVISVPAGCRAGRTYVLRNATHVSAPVSPDPEACDQPLSLTIYPAAQVDGELLPPEGDRLDGHGELEVLKCRVSPHEPRQVLGVYPFAIDQPADADETVPEELGLWSAVVPAGCVDLHLTTGEYARLDWRRRTLKAQNAHHLDRRQLKYASTLVVRVADADGRPIPGADLRLIPAEALDSYVRSTPNSFFIIQIPDISPPSTVTDREGWARFENMDAGIFHVAVQTRERPVFYSDPVETEARLTTTLDPLTLPPTAELEILLEEFESDLASSVVRVVVMLQRTGEDPQTYREQREADIRVVDDPEPPKARSSDPHVDNSVPRRAVFHGMTPGTWESDAMAIFSERWPYHFGQHRLRLEPGTWESLRLEFRHRRYNGRLTYQGEPTAGKVRLQCEPAGCSGSDNTTADAEGRFSVLLSDPGSYTATVHLEPGSGRLATVSGLRFDDPDDEVEIDVEGLQAHLEGQVVDAEGEPVTGIYVHARGLAPGRPELAGRALHPHGRPRRRALRPRHFYCGPGPCGRRRGHYPK